MDEILYFSSSTFYHDQEPEDHTIEGEKFRALMDLCFAHTDRFSLLRSGWPRANAGLLEQALHPFCLGEYRSYARISIYNKVFWYKCYLYPATEETKAILLRYIPHLFGREPDAAPEGHTEYLEKKYAAYYKARDAAEEQIDKYLETEPDPDTDTFLSFSNKVYCEARTIWQQIFDPKDYYSIMEDPCFFRRDEMFFETVTHERDCFVHVFSDEFGVRLRELGKWADVSDRNRLPLFSLKEAKDLVLY